MRDLLRIDKQPPKRKEGDPSLQKKGREDLLTKLRAAVTECKLSARIMQETFTLITHSLAETATLLPNEPQKE